MKTKEVVDKELTVKRAITRITYERYRALSKDLNKIILAGIKTRGAAHRIKRTLGAAGKYHCSCCKLDTKPFVMMLKVRRYFFNFC